MKSLTKPFMNKKGMEIAVNTLVVLILSILIFGGGIALFYKAFAKGEQQAANLDQATQQQIENALDDGSLVAIPVSSKTISPGGHATIGVGVTNEDGTSASHPFALVVTYAGRDPPPNAPTGSAWIKFDGNEIPLQNGQKHVFQLYFVPSGANQKGVHIFNVAACYDGEDSGTSVAGSSLCAAKGLKLYENLHKIYLTIH